MVSSLNNLRLCKDIHRVYLIPRRASWPVKCRYLNAWKLTWALSLMSAPQVQQPDANSTMLHPYICNIILTGPVRGWWHWCLFAVGGVENCQAEFEELQDLTNTGQHMSSSVSSAQATCCAFSADAANLHFSGATRQPPDHSLAMRCVYVCVYLCTYGNTCINACMVGTETHSHVCLHACAYVKVHVCIYVCMYFVRMYAHTCAVDMGSAPWK